MPAQSQSVTKSSHYVSVTQSSSAGAATSSRYLSWTVGGRSHYFCSLPGILRILEILLVLVVLVMARVGNHVSKHKICQRTFTLESAQKMPSQGLVLVLVESPY